MLGVGVPGAAGTRTVGSAQLPSPMSALMAEATGVSVDDEAKRGVFSVSTTTAFFLALLSCEDQVFILAIQFEENEFICSLLGSVDLSASH